MDRRLDDQAIATKIALALACRGPSPLQQNNRKPDRPQQDSLKQRFAEAKLNIVLDFLKNQDSGWWGWGKDKFRLIF